MRNTFIKRLLCGLLLICMLVGMLPAGVFATEQKESKAANALQSTSGTISATAEEVATLFSARSEGQHPRILADADKFAELRQLIQTDDYMKVLYARIYEEVTFSNPSANPPVLSWLDQPVSEYEIPDGLRLLGVSRTASSRIIWLAMLYQLSGERRFAERAVAEMLAVCDETKFPDWNHNKHYLDVGQMAYGVGIGYDWLYHFMTEAERKIVREGLYRNVILTEGKGPHSNTGNWNQWCMAGFAVAATAIYEHHPAECSALLAKTVTSIQKALNTYTPLGAYPEAPAYFRLGSEFTAIYIDTLMSTLGTDFGLSDLPGMRESGKYLLAMNGYVNTFNFGDCDESIASGAMLHWYANRYNMPELSVYQRKFQSWSTELYDEPLALLWYDPALVEDFDENSQQLDYLMYSDAYQSVASFRSFNADPYQVYAAIKSGYNSTSHADMDIGTFVMEAMGERWFTELGKDNYNLPGYGTFSGGKYTEEQGRWDYYRKRTEGQNTLVINPGEGGGQDVMGKAQITDYVSSYDGGYATVDMLDAYDDYGATGANRGLMLFDNRSRVLLRDEITMESASELYWFAHTAAEIAVSDDGKTAELSMNGKKLLAQLVEPANAEFTGMKAEPLATSPVPDRQGQTEQGGAGYNKLAIHLTNVTEANITVVFTPILEEADRNKALPDDITLENLKSQLHDYDATTTLTKNAQGVYEIYNVEQLCLLSENVRVKGMRYEKENFKLMNDIDMQGRTFTPIGGCTTDGMGVPFHGNFDGNNHVIKNLLIYEPDMIDVAFFGKIYNNTVKNLGIENGFVYGGERAAGLAGTAGMATVEGCYNKANVISVGKHVGGVVAMVNFTSTVRNCYNNADVKSETAMVAGGVIGYLASESITTIENCYHIGNLSDTENHTGLIGYYVPKEEMYYSEDGKDLVIGTVTVKNCYATTAIKPAAVVDNPERESYADNATVTEAELVGLATTLGNAFIADCEWENDGYPVLQWQCDTVLPSDLALSTAAELRLLSYKVRSGQENYSGKTVTLLNDIDLDSREWVPIGGGNPEKTTGTTFYGTFDGKGFAVKNLKISTNYYFNGFFGSANGTVKNFGIKSGLVEGYYLVAAVAAQMVGTLGDCYNRAYVRGYNYVGGLVGQSGVTTITNCYNTGKVEGSMTAGGLVSYFTSTAAGASMKNCYNAGTVTGTTVGYLVATFNDDLNSTPIAITSCYCVNGGAQFYDETGYAKTDCVSYTAADLKAKAITGYSFDTLIPRNGGYPVLNTSLYGSAAIAEADVMNYDGITEYKVYTADQLRAVAYMRNVKNKSFPNKTVKLYADIDLKNQEWIPIGGNNTVDDAPSIAAFAGTFDGNGHVIRNLCITSGNYAVGLIGATVNNAAIKNLGLENGMVIGAKKVAALVGRAGGAIKIDSCYTKVNVSANDHIGGIAGMIGNQNASVTNCYNTGVIGAKISGAGIIGYFGSGSNGTKVENCYNLNPHSTGIVGFTNDGSNAVANSVTVNNCYTIEGTAVIGPNNKQMATVTNSSAVSAATMAANATTLGSAFTEDYQTQNGLYPVLTWQNAGCPTSLTQENGVYLINTVEDLRLFSYIVNTYSDPNKNGFMNKKVLLTADLDLKGEPWQPIGCYAPGGSRIFRGTFDGGGHTISNLYCMKVGGTTDDYKYVGLFGMVSTGGVENVGIESGCLIGYEHVAGIIGNMSGGADMRKCYNKATVYGRLHVGGLIGMINTNNVVVENCYNRGAVYARTSYTGAAGLVGYFATATVGSKIINCYDTGNYVTAICTISLDPHKDTGVISNSNVVENVYSVGGVKMVSAGGDAYSLVSTSLVTPVDMRGYYTVLGTAFAPDKKDINDGYPILMWEAEYEEPRHTELFFDFTNTEADHLRYDTKTYGYIQFDEPETPRWSAPSDVMAGVEINGEILTLHAKGTIGDTIHPAVYTDTYASQSNGYYPLHFDPSETEVFQIRFKMKNFEVGDKVTKNNDGTYSEPFDVAPYLKLVYYAEGQVDEKGNPAPEDATETYKVVPETGINIASYINADEWLIVTIPVKSAFTKIEEVTRLRVYFGGIESISEEQPGQIDIDYIYLGSEENLPGQKDLYFTFNNTEEDQIRYNSKTYGYVQFDDPEDVNWNYSSKLLTGVAVGDGALTLNLRGEYDPSTDYPGVYADTYDKGRTEPLYYDPAKAEVYQIRFKMEGLTKDHPDPNKTGQPYVDLHLMGLGLNGEFLTNETDLNQPNFIFPESTLTSGEYIIVTVPLDRTKFENCSVITRVRPYFGQVKSADPNNGGKITIDYIYLGTEADMPTPRYTVTFMNADGSKLGSVVVHRGETAVYPGATNPSKSNTSSKHYIFNGWNQDLTNVQGNMTVTAVYKEENHKYSYEVTKKPTVDEAGTLRGTCSVCGRQTTITLPKLDETNYTKKEVKATSCIEAGEYEYTWKTTSYGSYTFKDYPAAFGHDYGSSVTKPDCEKPGHTTYTCKRCGFTYNGNEVGALGHTEVTDPAIAPTCTDTGLTAGSHCSVCGKVLVAQQVIKELGHTYDEGAVTLEPTCSQEGIRTFTCCNDSSHTRTEPIEKLLHTDMNSDELCDACPGLVVSANVQNLLLDYDRTIDKNVMNAAMIDDISDELMRSAKLLAVSFADASDEALGTATLVDTDGDGEPDGMKFVPTGILSETIRLRCSVRITAKDGKTYQRVIPVVVVPSTISYYETDAVDGLVEMYTHKSGIAIELTEEEVSVSDPRRMSDIELDREEGILSGAIVGQDPYITVILGKEYVIQEGDIVRVRMRVAANTVHEASKMEAKLFLDSPQNPGYASARSTELAKFNANGMFQVLTMELKKDCIGMTVDKVRFDPVNITDNTNPVYDPVGFELDWIYIGPPTEDVATHIFEDFDFDGVKLVDDIDVPIRGMTAELDVEEGVVKGSITGGDPFFVATNPNSYNYVIQEGDVVKVRMKVDPSVDFTSTLLRAQAFFGTDEYGGDPQPFQSTEETPFIACGNYRIVTMKLRDESVGQEIVNLRIDPIWSDLDVELTDKDVPFAVDWIYVGPDIPVNDNGVLFPETQYDWTWVKWGEEKHEEMSQRKEGDPYGYDAAYADDTTYSAGRSLFVVGAGVPNVKKDSNGNQYIDYAGIATYTEATFTFTGTGFDIIGRTGARQGGLRIVICDMDGTVKRTMAVINSGVSDLYQVPVASFHVEDHELSYGTYKVHIFVNEAYDYGNDGSADEFGGALDRGGEFYFDAIRIYEPIDTSAKNEDSAYAHSVYQGNNEADPTFVEVRQLLLDAKTLKPSENNYVNGVVYLDSNGKVAEYSAVGPNNEVYLGQNNAIAFKLVVEGAVPDRIDIGAKSAVGAETSLCVGVNKYADKVSPGNTGITVSSATAMYYPITVSNWAKDENGNSCVYVAVKNTKNSILSITDIKYAYGPGKSAADTKSVRFLVDTEIMNGMLPAVDENLTFGANLVLENDLTMNFRVKADKLAAYDLSTAYLVVERDIYESGAKEAFVETTVISEYAISNDGRLVFSYPGIAAAQMNDAIRATLYIKDASGKEYVSPVLNTSVATYLDGLLSNSASDTKLVTLIMDMVNYGAAAQIYFDRHADAPVNEAFESFKTYASYASSDFTTTLENLSATTDSEGKSGKLNLGLDLGTRIGIQYKVTVPANVNVEDVTLVVTDRNGNELETLQVAGNPTDSKGRYVVNFYGFTSRDMRRIVYATAYAGGEAITGTYAYSISTYAWGIQTNAAMQPENLVNVTRAMMLYGDSANAYFA